MADKKKPEKSPDTKPSLKDKKKLDISAVAIVDNIVFSKTERWAYYRLSNEVFDFLSSTGKIQLALQTSNALNALMNDRQQPLDCHIIVTSIPVDVDAWAAQVRSVSRHWDRGPGFERYVDEQINHLKHEEYLKKVAYFGVNIGKRGALEREDINFLEMGLKGATEALKNWWSSALQVPTEEVSAEEEAETRKKEKGFYTTLSVGNLQATRCTTEELLLLIKRQFYPNMPSPYLDVDHDSRIGPGDLNLELHSAVKNKYRWMEFNQMVGDEEVAGYRACLSFSKFRKFDEYPYQGFPFFYLASKLGLPFTCYARFTLHPSNKMKKDLERKRREQRDELENLSAGQDEFDAMRGAPTEVVESMQDMDTIEALIAQDKTPWVEGSYRIVVETHTEELLRKYCTYVKSQYAEIEINATWSSGDQAELFLEQMPGDHLRVKSFNQLTNLTMLSTSGFNFSSDVGDPIFGSDGEVQI